MDAWVWWIVIACVLAVGEVMTTSFFLAPFAGGALVAALVAAVGLGTGAGLAAFVAFSAALLLFVRPIARRHLTMPAQLRTGTAALIGRNAVVVERIANHEGVGCAKIDGEVWTARAFDEDRTFEAGERVQVIEIRGATALVDLDRKGTPPSWLPSSSSASWRSFSSSSPPRRSGSSPRPVPAWSSAS